MANLIIEFDKSELKFLHEMRIISDSFRARTLGAVGKAGRVILKERFLMGQAIKLNDDRDSKGRMLTSYSVGKDAQFVKITSYPMNLFERGRMLRSGKREPGKKVFNPKLKNIMSSEMQGIVNRFDSSFLQKELDKI